MSLIIDPSAPKLPQQTVLPTVQQITGDLGGLLANFMQFFKMNQVPHFYIHSLGVLISQLTFSDDPKQRQTAAEIQLLAQKQAAVQLEEMRLWLLKQSVPSGPIN